MAGTLNANAIILIANKSANILHDATLEDELRIFFSLSGEIIRSCWLGIAMLLLIALWQSVLLLELQLHYWSTWWNCAQQNVDYSRCSGLYLSVGWASKILWSNFFQIHSDLILFVAFCGITRYCCKAQFHVMFKTA